MTVTLPPPDRFSLAGKSLAVKEHVRLLVVGAGPAGCAAAIEAAETGIEVMLVDENPVSSGLIGLDVPLHFGGRATNAVQTPDRLVEPFLESSPALAKAFEAGVDVRLSTSVWGAWVKRVGLNGLATGIAGLADSNRSWFVGFDRIIVATGARDLNLSFLGSEQPGVMGALGLGMLLERYDAFAGRRLVIVGSGALAASTATLALDRGLEVTALVEVGETPKAGADAIAALQNRGVEIVIGHVPLEAVGRADGVERLVLCRSDDRDARREIACDTVCMAVSSVPVIELFDVLGAAREMAPSKGGHVPIVSKEGATSLAEVFAAGDCAGLGAGLGTGAAESGRRAASAALRSLGADRAAEATPASVAAATDTSDRDGDDDALAYPLAFARAMLATGGTDVHACLCEEVSRGDLTGVKPPRYLAWQSETIDRRNLSTLAADGPLDQDQMKRLTRVCMGPCQARRCREQVAMLMAIGAGIPVSDVPLAGYRAPVRPLPLNVLADWQEASDMDAGWNVWFGIATQWIAYDDIGTEREAEQLRAGMPY